MTLIGNEVMARFSINDGATWGPASRQVNPGVTVVFSGVFLCFFLVGSGGDVMLC